MQLDIFKNTADSDINYSSRYKNDLVYNKSQSDLSELCKLLQTKFKQDISIFNDRFKSLFQDLSLHTTKFESNLSSAMIDLTSLNMNFKSNNWNKAFGLDRLEKLELVKSRFIVDFVSNLEGSIQTILTPAPVIGIKNLSLLSKDFGRHNFVESLNGLSFTDKKEIKSARAFVKPNLVHSANYSGFIDNESIEYSTEKANCQYDCLNHSIEKVVDEYVSHGIKGGLNLNIYFIINSTLYGDDIQMGNRYIINGGNDE